MTSMAKRRPTVLFVGATSPPVHGMTVFTEMLLDSSLATRFRLVHLDTADRRNVGQMGRFDFWNVFLGIKHVTAMAWLIVRHQPRIVYLPVAQNFWGYFRDAALITVARFFRRRAVIHIHGGYFRTFYGESGALMRWLIRSTIRYVSRVIVLGECLRHIVPDCVNPDRIAVVPNGIDAPSYVPMRRTVDGECTVAYLGTLMAAKGVVDVVEAAVLLKQRGVRGLRFRFAGAWMDGDSAEADCRRIIEENGLDSFVEFVGVVRGRDKSRFLQNADIFVFPTRIAEGQPQCILEAMAASLPVIATDHGAIRETVLDRETGLLIGTQSPEQIAKAIGELMNDPERLCNYGRMARDRFDRHYTQEQCVDSLSRVFEAAMGDEWRITTR